MHSMHGVALFLLLPVVLAGCLQRTDTTGGPKPLETPPKSSPREEIPGAYQEVFKRGLPTGDLKISRRGRSLLELHVEIADSPATQETGLMNVRDLPEAAGMAFMFDVPTQTPFHMKNTLIPLDVAFWDEEETIVEILQMTPCESDPCPIYSPSRPYIGAVEVNRGLLGSKAVRVGDKVTLTLR